MTEESTGIWVDYSLKKEWSDFKTYEDQVIEIERASFPVPWSERSFKEEINRDISNLWALIIQKQIYAYICFWMFDKEIHILNFAVHPQKRRHGLGKYLLMMVINTGTAHGIENIWLEVRPTNGPALSIYTKLGFSDVGRRKGYYSDSQEDAIIMALDLAGNTVQGVRG
ncbi:MAG: ribosomal protein S18-alanine N-acetyltransferase [Desulfatiglans sp.]|nr:ribosomal protein S18-alanine N-acetyltransferase [Desulfatiglans sp.]